MFPNYNIRSGLPIPEKFGTSSFNSGEKKIAQTFFHPPEPGAAESLNGGCCVLAVFAGEDDEHHA